MLKNRGCTVVIIIFALLSILFFIGLDLYTDLVWLETLGLASVLWKRIGAEWLLFAIAWVVASAVLAVNWWLAIRLVGGKHLTIPWLRQKRTQHEITAEATIRVVSSRTAGGILAVTAVGIGFLFAQPARSMWLKALMSLNGVPFGQADPILFVPFPATLS